MVAVGGVRVKEWRKALSPLLALGPELGGADYSWYAKRDLLVCEAHDVTHVRGRQSGGVARSAFNQSHVHRRH
jgi:hypothetical protein